MKKTLLTTLLFISALSFAQERIAVFPFEVLDNAVTVNEAVQLYRNFSNQFTNISAGRFSVVPRQDIEKLINMEARFQLSDFSAKAKTAEMERVLNGTHILSGVIGKVGSRINVSVSLYTYPDLIQLPGGADMRVANKDELFDKIPELVQSMQDTIGSGGRPAVQQGQTAVPAKMVLVEGGTFQMGSANGARNERPAHTVTVKTFYIGKYEVTQKEWYEVMKSNPSQFMGDNLPVENVTWIDAIEFCNKLSVIEGLTPAYHGSGNNITCDWNANGYRLPTEAEWEFAAKGGKNDYVTSEYSGSNNFDSVAWYNGNSGKKTQPVGTKAANSLGIHDMSGNVWEWCWDWWGNYMNGTQTDPKGPASGKYRVLRGGSYGDNAWNIRSSSRGYNNSSFRNSFIGLRLARNAN